MSLFVRMVKKFNPDESSLNDLVNHSFLGGFYNLFCRYISAITGKISENSLVLNNIDNIYFVFLGILIFAIPFAKTAVLGGLAFVLILISIINSLLNHKKFEFSALHLPVFIYLAILLISVGFSSLLLPSLKGFMKMIIYIGAFFSFFAFLKKNPSKIIPTVVMIALSCCLELLFVLKQMIFGVESLASWQDISRINPNQTLNRIFGTIKPHNPNLLGAYLLACSPAILGMAIYAFLKNKIKIAVVASGFAILSLIALIQTGCRGAYIGLFFGIIFFVLLGFNAFKGFFAQKKDFKKILIYTILGLLLIGILAIIFSPSIMHRLESIFTLRGDSSNSYRMNVYISSLKMFLDNFWIGIGTGNTTYRLIYGLYMITGFDALGAYNIYLEMAVESGIFAPLTFFWMMILTFAQGIKKLFVLQAEYKVVILIALSAIFAMLFHGIFDTVWYRPQLQLLFWLYMAILAVVIMKDFAYAQK